MLKMIKEQEEPPSTNTSPSKNTGGGVDFSYDDGAEENGVISFFKGLIKPQKSDTTLRETIEEYIEGESGDFEGESVSAHEKLLISNILSLRDMSAADVMIPRADIVAISEDMSQAELLALLAERQYSRIPVYKDTLDNVTGAIHVKDILATLAQGIEVNVPALVRDIPIISPSMPVLDLLLQMRITRKHMVLVIDEFGGIDGLIAIGDVIEAIVGEIYDEHDPDDQPQVIHKPDGTVIADARFDLEEFEGLFGNILNEEERENHDTLGGLIFSMAGRVPARGEVLTHKSGLVFEILDADPRRVNKVCIRNIPQKASSAEA